jgi:hypothetical protein
LVPTNSSFLIREIKNLEPKMKPKVSKTPLFWFHFKIHGFMKCFYDFKKDVAATLLSNYCSPSKTDKTEIATLANGIR